MVDTENKLSDLETRRNELRAEHEAALSEDGPDGEKKLDRLEKQIDQIDRQIERERKRRTLAARHVQAEDEAERKRQADANVARAKAVANDLQAWGRETDAKVADLAEHLNKLAPMRAELHGLTGARMATELASLAPQIVALIETRLSATAMPFRPVAFLDANNARVERAMPAADYVESVSIRAQHGDAVANEHDAKAASARRAERQKAAA